MHFLQTPEYEVGLSSEEHSDKVLCFDEAGACAPLDVGYRYRFTSRQDDSWTGRFAQGMVNYSDVLATPSPRHCCIVMLGQAYLVDVAHPDRTLPLPHPHVVGHVGGPASSALVLVTFTELIGIRSDGTWWVSERLASDEIRNVTIDGDVVRGEGWIAATDTWTPFTLDAESGRIIAERIHDSLETG
ncbi:MAG: hypothetical protein KIT19_09925 [Phycisphaeraceae bacterium]|nr:hypothetical protein [Phycisphaeraceae bacterium]